MAALARAAGAIDRYARNPDHVARRLLRRRWQLVLALGLRHALRLLYEQLTPGLYMFVQARTHFIDRILQHHLDRGLPQLVILGAGLDTRAHRFHQQLRDTRVFEVDFPATAHWKRDTFARAGLPTDGAHLVDIDFNRETLASRLPREGFDPTRRTLFIWEGVSMYLPEAAVAETLALVGSCAPGSAIVFDYFYLAAKEHPERFHGARRALAFMRRRGEPCMFAIDADELPGFLARHHLELAHDADRDELAELVTLGPTRSLVDFTAIAVAEVPAA